MDPRAAREAALARLGDLAVLKRTCVDLGRRRDRHMRVTLWLDELKDDVKFAIRQLRRDPAFALVAIVTLALGIGANSAIFALVDATLLRPLPFGEPDRVVAVWERTDTDARGRVSPLDLLDWIERNHSFEQMAASSPGVGGMVMNGADGTAETVSRQWVSAGFFDVLGVRPVAGRTFLPSDDARRASVVVLSERFWRARFGGDPTVVGRSIRFDGEPYTVVGIVPAAFQLQGPTSMWALFSMPPRRPELRTVYNMQVFGRLEPGVTLDAARADMAAVAGQLARELPDTNKGRSVSIEPVHDALIGTDLRLTSVLFLGVVGFVLLICCANVANLLLARATVRTRELAIRSALGAGRRRVARQLLTESLVLSAIGGVCGAAVGAAIVSVAPALVPAGVLPAAVAVSFDLRVVTFCAAAALFVGVLFGLAPAWHATGTSFNQAISAGTRIVTARGGTLRSLLVAGEVALAVLLLVGAGLLLRTLIAVDRVDRGYQADEVLTMMVDPLGARYPTDESLLQFFSAIEHEVMALPGMRSVAWTTTLPLGATETSERYIGIVGDPRPDQRQLPSADYEIVSPAYFRTLGVPILAGRPFDERDTTGSVPVCIVNEEFVRRYLHGRTPVGMRVALRRRPRADEPPVIREIVGVARQVKGRPDAKEEQAQLYVPLAQDVLDDIYLLVRPGTGSAAALIPPVRAAIARVDREQLVSVRGIMTLDDVAWEASSAHRFRAVMVTTFAALALLLAMVGVFGILAYSVQQRVRDFAVRRALGATTRDVFRLVIGSAARVVAVGGVIGLGLAAALVRLLATVLFGVEPLDPLTFASVVLMLVVTAAAAALAPAWRAARIDPAAALRTE
jgi:putative ABC transport system permease protein